MGTLKNLFEIYRPFWHAA